MTPTDDLRSLSVGATPGPWRQSGPGDHAGWVFMSDSMPYEHQIVGSVIPDRPTDAELIVWLRNHADALADLIDAARPFADGCSCGDCHRLTAAFTALDQEAPT